MPFKRSSAGPRATVLVLALCCGCTPPPPIDRAPELVELQRLESLLAGPPAWGWSGEGHARLSSRDGEVEGALRVALDPPARARLEIRAAALFGLVGERLVVALPGDDHVLVYRAREDSLQRLPWQQTDLARLLPAGTQAEMHALVAGRLPWPGGRPPADLAARTRISRQGRDLLEYRVQLSAPAGVLEVQVQEGRLSQLVWYGESLGRVVVRYDRWRQFEEQLQPARLRLSAPEEGLEAEFDLETLRRRNDFTARDFEVY